MRNEVLSKPATDLIKIACAFGGYDKVELLARVLVKTNRMANITTVENILQELYEEGQS